jgi:hypothetical protein
MISVKTEGVVPFPAAASSLFQHRYEIINPSSRKEIKNKQKEVN